LAVDTFKMSPLRTRHPGSRRIAGATWWGPALAGAAAFWLSNLAISWTPVAADYRAAMSVPYVAMLLEAAVGGLVVAVVLALLLARFPDRIPGNGALRQAILLVVVVLVVVTLLVEVPSKLRAGVADPGHWLLVATVFNVIRFLALGVTIGSTSLRRATRQGDHQVTRREARSS
jgi:hypothetical protein